MNVVLAVVFLVIGLSFANEQIGQAVSAFLLAGVLPGISWQLPWYVVLVAVPLLLWSVGRFAKRLWTEATPAPATAKKLGKKTAEKPAARKKPATKKKKPATALPQRRFTQLEA